MRNGWLALAAANGFLSVAAGAFGAHALKNRLGPQSLEVFEIAARYQMIHALALFMLALTVDDRTVRLKRAAGVAFLSGILLFSGSLYAISLTSQRGLGAITPLGGVALLIGWALLFIGACQSRR